jgi:hypothetical protein
MAGVTVYSRTSASPGYLIYRMGETYHWSVWTELGGASGAAADAGEAYTKSREFADRLRP